MKWVWERIRSVFETAPMPNEPGYRDKIVKERVLRIYRKMSNGTWQFSWSAANKLTIVVIHPNLPELTKLVRRTASAIEIGIAIPLEAKRSPRSNVGTIETTLGKYLADSDGLYEAPQVVTEAFTLESIRLCEAIDRQRKKSPSMAMSYEGQCVYLFDEIEGLANALL